MPSFQNAFNEALLTASVSVLAAQSGECVFVMSFTSIYPRPRSYTIHEDVHVHAAFMFLNSHYISASEGKPGSRTAKKGRKKLVLFSTGGMRGVN